MLDIALKDPSQKYSTADLFARLGVDIKPGAVAVAKSSNPTVASEGLFRACGEGERNVYLTRIAGRLIAKGLSIAEVGQICRDWNARNTVPLEVTELESTVDSIWKAHLRNHPDAAEQGQEIQPLFDPAAASVDSLLRTSPAPRDWLLDDCLPLGKVGLLVAGGGTGKSQLLLQLGVAVASKTRLAEHWAVGSSGKALLLFAEDEIEEVHRRLECILKEHTGTHISALLRQNLLIKSLVGINNQMTVAMPSGGVKATDWVDRLLLTCAQIPDLKLIVIDPASRFRGGNENAADDATRFVEQAERIAKETGATVLIAHHVNKASQQSDTQSQASLRGSSALSDGVRWQMNLTRFQDTAAKKFGITEEDLPRMLKAEVTKNNYAAGQYKPVLLYRKDGGYLTVLQNAQKAVTLEDRIKDLVTTEIAAGRTYSANSFEVKFGGVNGALQLGKNAVREAIKGLLKSTGLTKTGSKNHLTTLQAVVIVRGIPPVSPMLDR